MQMDQKTTGRQIATARTLLGWTQAELAEKANISVPTLKRMEASKDEASGLANNVLAVNVALQSAGIIFISPGETSPEGGAGVRLKD